MGLVVVGVQCVSASSGRCYARELVSVAEEFNVPLTWFIGVSSKDPMGNANLYRNEYLHRIPSWHEIGLLLDLSNGAVSSDKARGDLIRLGKEVLKQCHVKPTACWVTGNGLDEGVIRVLEDVGVLLAISTDKAGSGTRVGLFHHECQADSREGAARIYRLSSPIIALADAAATDRVLPGDADADQTCTLVWTRDDRDDVHVLRRVLQETCDAGIPVRVATAAIRG